MSRVTGSIDNHNERSDSGKRETLIGPKIDMRQEK